MTVMFFLLRGAIAPAEEEAVLPAELREAWFTILKAAHSGQPRPGPYYARCGAASIHSRRWQHKPLVAPCAELTDMLVHKVVSNSMLTLDTGTAR